MPVFKLSKTLDSFFICYFSLVIHRVNLYDWPVNLHFGRSNLHLIGNVIFTFVSITKNERTKQLAVTLYSDESQHPGMIRTEKEKIERSFADSKALYGLFTTAG